MQRRGSVSGGSDGRELGEFRVGDGAAGVSEKLRWQGCWWQSRPSWPSCAK